MRAAGQTPIRSNVAREVIMRASADKQKNITRKKGVTQSALNARLKATWKLATQRGELDGIIQNLGNMGVFDFEGIDSMDATEAGKVATKRFENLGPTAQLNSLHEVVETLGLGDIAGVNTSTQRGPGLDFGPEEKGNPEERPLDYLLEHRQEIENQLNRVFDDVLVAENVIEAMGAVAQEHRQAIIEIGRRDPAAAGREAVSQMVAGLQSIFHAQIGPETIILSAADALNIAWDAFMAAPGFIYNAFGRNIAERIQQEYRVSQRVRSYRRSTRGIYNTFNAVRNTAKKVVRDLAGEPVQTDIMGIDPARIEEVMRAANQESHSEVYIDENGQPDARPDSTVVRAVLRAIESGQSTTQDVLAKFGSAVLSRLKPTRTDRKWDREEVPDDDDGPPDDDDDDDPLGGGGGGWGPPRRNPRAPYIFEYGGRRWTLKKVASAIAILLSIGYTTYQIVDKLSDVDKKGKAEVPIAPRKKKESPSIPAETPMPSPSRPTGEDHTYEPGPDGKPKLFPGYSSGNVPGVTEYKTPEAVPAGRSVSKYKLTMPVLVPPPTGKYTSRDFTYGLNTDDDTVRALMDERPELAEMIMKYNANAASYNLAKQRGDTKEAADMYSQLRLASAEIANASRTPLDREGADAYSLRARETEYSGTDTIGQKIMLKHVRTKTARTAALGLDDEIEAFNSAALKLNKLAADGASSTPEYKAALAEYNTLLSKMDRVEGSPSSAVGTVRPKLIEEQYPKRIQDLTNMAIGHQDVTLTDEDVELLEKYPSAGRPIFDYVAYRKRYPSARFVDKSINDRLIVARDSGFKLGVSKRPFAEGLHQYPPTVQKVIDRIASSDGRTTVIISQRERQAIAEYPELEARVTKYENDVKAAPKTKPITRGGRVFEAITPEDVTSDASASEFRTIQAGGYRGVEPVASSIAEVEDKIAQDSADLLSTSAMLKDALAGRAPRSQIEELYRRQNMLRARLAAERADVSGRGTYLSDVSRENLPTDENERKAFLRLQNVEREFQGRQDALFEYNEQERGIDYTGMTKAQAYDARLRLLESIASKQGLDDVYQTAFAKDTSVMDEDADTVVNLPDDPEAAARDQEGSERADMIDPDERSLFLRSHREEAREFKNWEDFSHVAPGFGLGGPKYNTLQRVNAQAERRRFSTVTMPPTRQQTKYPPRPVELRGYEGRQPSMIPIYESDFGLVHYEDAYHNDYQQGRRIVFTDPYQDDADRRSWLSPQNVYQPDNAGYAYAQYTNTSHGRHMVPIGEVSKPREYYGTNRRFCDTNGPNHRLQNRANSLPDEGESTMITTERSGHSDLRPRIIDVSSAVRAGVYSTRR